MHRKAKSFGSAVYIVLYCIVLYCTALHCTVLISLMKTMHVAEAVPHYLPKVTENYVLSQKTKKPKSQRLLRLCLAPPLQESLRFGFFGFFGTVHHFGLVMVINLGQLQQNAWFSKKIQHNCKDQGPNPDPTYSYERRAGTVTRLRGVCFCLVFGDSVSFFISFC